MIETRKRVLEEEIEAKELKLQVMEARKKALEQEHPSVLKEEHLNAPEQEHLDLLISTTFLIEKYRK